jgi:ABC-type transport system involved in multi-copper enzyme maturation permease subunit
LDAGRGIRNLFPAFSRVAPMIESVGSFVVGLFLLLFQVLAALPWVIALDPRFVLDWLRKPRNLLGGSLGILGLRLLLRLYFYGVFGLDSWGRIYAAILQLQLTIDLFLLVFAVLLLVWPRGGAVALVAFREGIRQPVFWLLLGGAAILMVVLIFVPYFTFGDDYKMMKQLGFDLVMLVTAFFVVLNACLSIGEEIEGRTAVTLMSKPLSRRQFLLGKFLGILLAGLAMTALLGWSLTWALYFKPMFDSPLDEHVDLLQVQFQPSLNAVAESLPADETIRPLLQGAAQWTGGALAIMPGLTIGFCQAMVLLSVAAALATRLPLVVNMVACGACFFLGNLAPHLVNVAAGLRPDVGGRLVQFTAGAFDTVLPALDYFSPGPAIVRDQPLPLGGYLLYVASVMGYSAMYTVIALLAGLILFEDRDLA